MSKGYSQLGKPAKMSQTQCNCDCLSLIWENTNRLMVLFMVWDKPKVTVNPILFPKKEIQPKLAQMGQRLICSALIPGNVLKIFWCMVWDT